ncbi:MazG nucleotide pyrophosphohydrolase domain-containing protein [Arthrobacter sp. CAN_A1]|uniref:MazG nucleotide pyrophosphohydrolase domain-containing protein n=1 Tax=Arthrobacter sp. CAN_A1 TaxID=2787717 RepID=UPI001A2F2A8B
MPESVPGPTSPAGQHPLDRLVEVVAQLREHCPWMGALTHASLVEYLVEECYELVDALAAFDAGDPGEAGATGHLRGELGDVLLQVVLHAQLQREQGSFDLSAVVDGLTRKMIRRNPHVFTPDGTLQASFPATVESIIGTWHQVKRAEEPQRADPFHGIPTQLPALALAAKTLRRTAEPVPEAAGLPTAPHTEEDLGDLLLSVVQQATAEGLDPERALRSAVLRLQQRARQAEDTIGAGAAVSTRLGGDPVTETPTRSGQP